MLSGAASLLSRSRGRRRPLSKVGVKSADYEKKQAKIKCLDKMKVAYPMTDHTIKQVGDLPFKQRGPLTDEGLFACWGGRTSRGHVSDRECGSLMNENKEERKCKRVLK